MTDTNDIKQKTELSANKILIAEFEYARETAAQAMEDRHRMVNFYLIFFGVVLNGVLLIVTGGSRSHPQMSNLQPFRHLVILLLLALFFVGVLYLMKIIRLRGMWFNSAEAMNEIKDYYIKHSSADQLKSAFLWNTSTLNGMKPAEKWSIFYLTALLISFLGAASLGAALYMVSKSLLISFPVFIVFIFLQMIYYSKALDRINEKRLKDRELRLSEREKKLKDK